MIIRGVRLQHFGIFFGEQEIQLDRGLSVIHGENGRGKTTFLNALRWALFGEYEDRQARRVPLDVMLNREAARLGDHRFGVDLEIEDAGASVLVRRSAVIGRGTVRTTSSEVKVEVDGQLLTGGDAERELARILDRRLARFALFDGEQLQDYEALLYDGGGDVRLIKQSIEQILGVRSLERTLDDLAAVRGQFDQEFARLARREKRAGRLGAEIDKLAREVAAQEQEASSLAAEEADLRARIARQDEYLQRYEQAMADLTTIEALESQLQQLRAREKELQDAAAEHMKVVPYDLLARLVHARSGTPDAPVAELEQAVLRTTADASLAARVCALCNRPFSSHELDDFAHLVDTRFPDGHDSPGRDGVLHALRLVALRDTGHFNDLRATQHLLDDVDLPRLPGQLSA